MPFDASALWWPPFSKLYTQLETLKLEPSAVSADALKAALTEYKPWLARGVAGFRPPSDASRRALEAEPSLSIGAKKLPVEAGLRAAALDVSRALHLDEVQAYVLLRRWATKAGPAALAPAGGGGAVGGGAAAVVSLSPAQRLAVAQMYWQERLLLLKAIEDLLWEGELSSVGGPLLDVIEGSLQQLLGQALEDTTFQALQTNLEADGVLAGGAGASSAGTSGTSTPGALLPSNVSGTVAAPPLAIAAFSAGGSGGGNGAAAAAAALSDGRLQATATERCSLLIILTLIYYHPRKQCTPDRFLSLAKLFHARLFTRTLPRSGGGAGGTSGGEPSPAQLSIKLATLLLLEMLDVDKALAALASGQPIDEASYVFAAPGVKQRVNAELSSWWSSAAATHSPVLLAWSAVLCLIRRSTAGGWGEGGGSGEWEAHASKAHETDALGTLCQLTTHVSLNTNVAEIFNNIVLSTMAASFAAFDLSAAALPLPQLELVTATLANLFRDQPALCEGFWACDRVTDEPLRHFLDDLRGLYPAFPCPLHTLLAALSATADSAASANAYLSQLPGLACLHVLPDPAVEEECNEDGDAYARQPIPLPGARTLTLPQGVLGEVLPLPEGLTSADSLWAVAPGADIESVQLIRWRLTLPDGAGQWILLCRLAEALALVASSGGLAGAAGTAGGQLASRVAAAQGELATGLQLLATFCSRDPQTALELLHVELPTASGVLEGGQRGPDLLSLACQAAATLAHLPDPPAGAIGDCLAICGALAEGIPGRVAQEVLALCGARSALAAAAPPGPAADVPLLARVLAVECAVGRYPATQALLRLLTTLVSAASPAPALQVLVVWVLHRVLAEHRQWRYALRSERWRLAGLALRLVRLALLSAPSPESLGGAWEAASAAEGGSAVAAAVAAILRYDVGMGSCLLTALPPHAEQLEQTSVESRYADEVAAVEECCREWHRLLPALLPVASPAARLAPGAFFRVCAAADGSQAGTSSAAATLLSYISYPYFSSSERALVMRSMHCLAAAAADAAPGAVFAVLLPQENPEAGVASAARGAIAAAFSLEAAAATPQLLGAACDALVAAVHYHPSLLDALLFPCRLEQALVDKENTSSNASGDATVATGGGKAAAKAPPPPRSCLDALWELLQQRERLQAEQPAVLAKLLQVLAAFWQSSGAAFRAVAVLQRQPGLWAHMDGLLEAACTAGPLSLPSLRGGEADEAATAVAWVEQEPAAALLSADACALQIAAAECHAWAASAGSATPAAPGMPADLAALLARLPADLAPRLLDRYSLPLPTASLLVAAQQAAAAGGLQLLGAALSDEALWRSMAEGGGLVPQLAAAAQPLLSQLGSQADAARMLTDHSRQIAARNFSTQRSAVAVAQLVMRQAEVPGRVADDRELGRAFVYDSGLFQRRLGSVMMAQLDALHGLSGWLDAASVAASLEDARLAAVTALKALLTAAHRQRAAGGSAANGASVATMPAAAVQAALRVLAEALGEVAAVAGERATAVQVEAAAAVAVDPVGCHLSNAAEAAYILLLLVQRWSAGAAAVSAAEEDAATALCTGLLQATGDWMEMLERTDVASLSSSPDAQHAVASITHSLLAAALVLLPAAPAASDAAAQLSQAQLRLQAVGTQLLPLLLAACHRQPPQLVLIVSLAAALIDRLVPAAAWLPLVRSHLHFGNLLHSLLLSLHTAVRQEAQHAVAQQRHHDAAVAAAPAGAQALAAPAAAVQGASEAAQQQEGVLGPLAAASVEEAVLLLALQLAQTRSGAELLVEQGAVAHALALGKWLLVPEGGNLMGEIPQAGGTPRQPGTGDTLGAPGGGGSTPGAVVDFSNAYRQDGSPNPAHRLWCCVLSLLAVLLAALPGHAAVEGAALQLAIEAEPRLLLAAEPPAASAQQPLTLAMAQEAKYALFLLCGLARLAGQWRVLLPDSLPAFRRATAAFLDFVASPGAEPISCAPVSPLERAAARAAEASGIKAGGGSSTPATLAVFDLAKGWFEAAASGAGGSGSAAAPAGGYAWQLADRLYSSAQYALAFQLALAPEVGEEEVSELGPEWVRPATLLALQEDVLGLAEDCGEAARRHPAAIRLCRTLQALLGLSSQMQDSLGAERPHRHKQAVAAAIARLAATSAGRRS